MKLQDLISIQSNQSDVTGKVTKVGAGYVHNWSGTDYRCADCILFIPEIQGCAVHEIVDVIRANGYCTRWVYGTPLPGLQPMGCLTKEESGYGELQNGTKCYRCKFFSTPGSCQKVDRNSPGDDPGRIDRNGCCDNQEPK